MKARYEAPALDDAGSFAAVTGGRFGWGRDWLGRNIYGNGNPDGDGGVIIIGSGVW